MGIYSCDFETLNINDMDYDKMTIESLAQWCHETSEYKINKADVESRIRHLVEQLDIPDVVGRSELLCPRCNSPLIYERVHTDGYSCNNCFHDWA